MSDYHWLIDLELYKGTDFYKISIKVFSKLTGNKLFKYLGKEDHLQIKVNCFMLSNYAEILTHHSPNEGKRTPIEQLRVAYFGVKAMPDVMIFKYKGSQLGDKYCGLAIELKIRPNRATPNQLNVLNQLENAGWKTDICYTLDEAINTINNYLN